MPAAKKPTTRRTSTARKRPASKEPPALRRLNKSLDSASDALAALRKDVGKDTSAGAKNLYRDVQRFVRDARRDGGKLGKALQKDAEQFQKRLASASKGTSRSGGGRKAPARSTGKRAASRSASSSRSRAK